MANLFRNELALILGILVAKHFKGNIKGWTPPGYGDKEQVYIPEDDPPSEEKIYGTGRGGYYRDPKGDVGRPGLMDEHISGITKGLAGQGGTLSYGGSGLYDGFFGIQKFVNSITNIKQISSGGGGGWYGGGWSMVGGGGGGGSSFVLSEYGFNQSGNATQNKILDFYLGLLPEEVRKNITEEQALAYLRSFFGVWYDRQEEVYSRYPWLYDLNTREPSILESKGFDLFIPFRQELDGNGAVLVSKVNQIITFEEETGFSNLDIRFNYTGKTQELNIEQEGDYHIIAYGGAGCDRWRGKDERYLGGFGGCASGIFHFKAGTKLYVNVGSRGYRTIYMFKNASIGLGGCTGGGSSSDVRYHLTDEASRIIVAGGGGGVFAEAGESEEPPENLKEIPTKVIDPERDEEGKYVEEEEEEKLKNMKFMVNDRSTVHVLVKSYNQIEIPNFAKTSCSIYINDGVEGELHAAVKPGGGVWVYEFQFKLNKIYPPNTPTHEVTIDAVIKTNFYSVLAKNGVMVWVTTDYSLTDTATDNKIKVYNNKDDFSIYDYYEIEKLVKRELTLKIEDILEIDDFYTILTNAKKDLEYFIYDEISIEDFYSKLIKLLTYKEIELSDNYSLEDFSLLDLKAKQDIIKELIDLIDINDFYETVKQTKREDSSSEYSEEEIEDNLVVSLVHLEYLYSNIEDTFELNDYVEIFIPKKITISGQVEPEGTASIKGLGVYEEGTNVSLTAVPAEGYQVDKWQIGDEDLGNSKTLIVKADTDKLVKLLTTVALLNAFDTAINKEGSTLTFTNESAIPWIVNENSYGGVRSGAISDSQSTEISTEITKAGIFYFDYKVSSEGGYDKIIVVRNNSQLFYYSGSSEGTAINLGVAVGDIIKFRYSKDSSGSVGDDCGYIKNVYVLSSDGLDEAAGTDGLTFTNESAIPWVPNPDSYGGIRSGKIYANQTTKLLLTCPRSGTLSFEYSVSSEGWYDYFTIYKNNNSLNSYGASSSGTYTLEVVEGDIIKFTYSKDGSGDVGYDAVFIRDIKII